ncbi:hypothetical protein GCM10023093_19470 [Nemorincola caseinilytica]|uniref:IgA Peptidase M64 n=1 Tax=Nemorincola caseinilytica TaxID=2054315 RepID=A0ABP8NGP4_9BACT
MRTSFNIILVAFLLLSQAAAFAQPRIVTTADGKKYTRIMLNGATDAKYDIVFIGDGFTASQQALFNSKVDEAVQELRTTPPYATAIKAFNIWRVNVISEESGISDPQAGIYRNTALSCRLGNTSWNEAKRCITSDNKALCYQVAGIAPGYNAVVVFANTESGGCASDIVFTSIGDDGFQKVITHELGHKIGKLGDEYTCYICDDPTDGGRVYSGGEPEEPNLTATIRSEDLKWRRFVTAGVPIPTYTDVPVGVVGAVEGGGYYPKKIYRPQFHCHMKELEKPFCAVCYDHLSSCLQQYNANIRRLRQNMIVHENDMIKIPFCFDCSYEKPLAATKLVLPDGIAENSTVEIIDEDMNILARGTPASTSLQFDQKAQKEYFIRIRSDNKNNGDATPQKITPSLFQNSRPLKLQ